MKCKMVEYPPFNLIICSTIMGLALAKRALNKRRPLPLRCHLMVEVTNKTFIVFKDSSVKC